MINKFISDNILKFFLVTLSILILGFAYSTTLHSIHKIWSANNETYSHGYLLSLFVCYLFYTNRKYLHFQPSLLPAIVAFLGSVIWFIANAVQIQVIQQLAIPLLILCILLSFWGMRSLSIILFPMATIYLALPACDLLITPLQNMTTYAVTYLLSWFQITSYVDGYNIHLPSGVLRVAGGCSGLNYLLTGLCIGIYLAYLSVPKKSHQLWVVLGAVAFALVGNWIRVFLLVLIGYYSEMQSSLVYDHGFFGWVIFATFFVGFFLWARRFEGQMPSQPQQTEQKTSVKQSSLKYLVTLAAATALPLFVQIQAYSEVGSSSRYQYQFTQALQSTFSKLNIPSWQPNYKGYDRAQFWQGRLDGLNLEVSIYDYFVQKQGKELIYFGNKIARRNESLATKVMDLGGLVINQSIITRGNQARLVFWFYRVGDVIATSGNETKLAQLKTVFDDDSSAALVTLTTPCQRDCQSELRAFEQENSAFRNVLVELAQLKGTF